MADKKLGATRVRIEEHPPRPATGDGEVLLQVGKHELTLKWEGGEIVDVSTSSEASADEMAHLTVSDDPFSELTTTKAIRCFKCWVNDETGEYVCLPTAC